MLQQEHSAILSTFIELPFVIKTFVLSIFEWLLKTGFTVGSGQNLCLQLYYIAAHAHIKNDLCICDKSHKLAQFICERIKMVVLDGHSAFNPLITNKFFHLI